jgi:hypothetical protein
LEQQKTEHSNTSLFGIRQGSPDPTIRRSDLLAVEEQISQSWEADSERIFSMYAVLPTHPTSMSIQTLQMCLVWILLDVVLLHGHHGRPLHPLNRTQF